jgi:hypothetical protein
MDLAAWNYISYIIINVRLLPSLRLYYRIFPENEKLEVVQVVNKFPGFFISAEG